MSKFGTYLPPGADPDGGHSDLHECNECGRLVGEGELDDEASEAFLSVCEECATRLRAAREDEEEGEV